MGSASIIELHTFAIPCWTVEMPISPAQRDALLSDLRRVPPDHRLPDEPEYHTDHVLATLPGDHWRAYRRAVGAVADRIAGGLGMDWRRRAIYTSALRYTSLSDYPRQVGHAHVAATLVVAMPLLLPPELAGTPEGGTSVRTPLPSLVDLCGSPELWSPPARELSALVFPGFLDHRPTRPPDNTDFGDGRVLLTADVCYF